MTWQLRYIATIFDVSMCFSTCVESISTQVDLLKYYSIIA